MTLFLLDTNIASMLVRGDDGAARARFRTVTASQCRLSVISEAEIRFGLARRNWPQRLSMMAGRFLASVEILPWTSREAEAYARLLVEMRAKGKSLSIMDSLIATQAMAANAVLVTADRAFGHVPGLRVENWAA